MSLLDDPTYDKFGNEKKESKRSTLLLCSASLTRIPSLQNSFIVCDKASLMALSCSLTRCAHQFKPYTRFGATCHVPFPSVRKRVKACVVCYKSTFTRGSSHTKQRFISIKYNTRDMGLLALLRHTDTYIISLHQRCLVRLFLRFAR